MKNETRANKRGNAAKLSPGCRSCQKGTWLCVFLTYRCRANCAFCPSPAKQRDQVVSAFGDTPARVLGHLRGQHIEGISFSGGDCFLVYERLVEWLTFFRTRRPDLYTWAYTNGLAADRRKLERLARLGLKEIRYNIAATGYDDPAILQQIRQATRLFERVAVEIPSIPAHYDRLTAVLPTLDSIGTAYLNLHQYILTGEELRSQAKDSATFLLNKDTQLYYHVGSLRNTARIARFCKERRLRMGINNCSLKKKDRQMLKRRLVMGAMFRKDHERLRTDGLLETLLVPPAGCSDAEMKALLASDQGLAALEKYCVDPARGSLAGGRARKLVFMPPLSVDGRRILLHANER